MASPYIPASHLSLLEAPIYAVFTTVSPSHAPENTVVWFSWDGNHILINTAGGRRKHRNILGNPQVALTLVDPQDPYRWLDIRGTIAEIVPDNDYANINYHTQRYTEHEEYYGGYTALERKGTEERLIMKFKIQRVVAY